jgi:acyl-CoA dehydrogenase
MDFFSDAIERLFAARSAPQQIRAIEDGGSASTLWNEIHESGFADALVAEAKGGAGLALADVFGVLLACGAHALPVPLALTMMARAVLAEAGETIPAGPITVAPAVETAHDKIVCQQVAYARTSDWVLVSRGGTCTLLPINHAALAPTGGRSLAYDLHWRSPGTASFVSTFDWPAACAALFAAQIAGAMERIFTSTVRYANERSQFGRPIGKFQAVQQQISQMAELVAAARMAAQLGASAPSHVPDPLLAAVAKARTSEAVVPVAAIAHAVHGAIGITEEYDLQLYTRRLHEWRAAFGSETYWNLRIGEALLREATPSLVFIRERLFAPTV